MKLAKPAFTGVAISLAISFSANRDGDITFFVVLLDEAVAFHRKDFGLLQSVFSDEKPNSFDSFDSLYPQKFRATAPG